VELEPSSISSLRHWHEGEDEFVYVLSGELTLIDEHGEHVLTQRCIRGISGGGAKCSPSAQQIRRSYIVPHGRNAKAGRETIDYPDDPKPGIPTIERDSNG